MALIILTKSPWPLLPGLLRLQGRGRGDICHAPRVTGQDQDVGQREKYLQFPAVSQVLLPLLPPFILVATLEIGVVISILQMGKLR